MKIAIIGMGNMGKAIAESVAGEVKGYDRDDDTAGVVEADVIFLCMKPQQLETLSLPDLTEDQTVVSILTGTPLDKIRPYVGHAKLVRLAPNLCAAIKRSINVYYSTDFEDASELESLFSGFGRVNVRVDDEAKFSHLVPLFGSGPAFLIYFLSAFRDFGEVLNVSDESLLELMETTAIWARESGKTFEELISSVASKGGVTEKGLTYWDQIDLHGKIEEGLNQAKNKESSF